jgi:hypothetical protein
MICHYDGFDIESFEAGTGLWHATIRRSDLSLIAIDGVLFPALQLGFAWPNSDAAIADATMRIDQFRQRFARPSLAPGDEHRNVA